MTKETLCKLISNDFHKEKESDFKKILKGSKYYCKRCGRAASRKKFLCKPAKIK